MGLKEKFKMDNTARYLIKFTSKIYRCTQMYLDKRLGKLNLSTGTFPFLLALSEEEGICQNKISKKIDVDKAMAARTIKKLIEIGYITKEANKEDVRAYKLYLTEKGRDIIPIIKDIIEEWGKIVIEGKTEEELEMCVKFLNSVLSNAKSYREKNCERKD